jgi:hypothetical protein
MATEISASDIRHCEFRMKWTNSFNACNNYFSIKRVDAADELNQDPEFRSQYQNLNFLHCSLVRHYI